MVPFASGKPWDYRAYRCQGLVTGFHNGREPWQEISRSDHSWES